VALGKGAFAGWALPSGLCRELPLGRGSAERKTTSAERIGALGRGIESGSEINKINGKQVATFLNKQSHKVTSWRY
jgi:hypothetical protein